MQNTPYYISKDFIAEIKGEEIIERYPAVDVFIEYFVFNLGKCTLLA